MTVIRPNSVSGITSITAQANEINFFRSNGTLAGLQLNGVNFNTTTGVSTFNNLDVGGVLTYQDVTNVDSIGIITARSNIDCNGDLDVDGHTNLDNVNIAGVATVTAAQADVATFTSNQTASTIYIKDTDGDGIFISGSSAYGHRIYTNTTEDLRLGTNSTERLRITSGGQVNIGGDYTQTAYNLSVTNTGGNLFRIKTASEGDYDLRFMVQNSESNIWHYGTDDFVFGNRYDRKLHFITNGSKRLTINGDLVGINETAPSNQLHIAGTTGTSAGGLLRLDCTTGDNFILYDNTHDNTEWAVGNDSATRSNYDIYYNNGSSYALRTRIDANGYFSIGGTSNVGTLLHVENGSGDAYIRCRASVNKAVLFNNNDGSAHGFIGSGGTNGGTGADLAVQSNSGNIVLHTPNGGGVRMPNQICFQAVRTSGGTVPSGTYMVYNAVDVNVGNDYNNSNGYFTAAVAGTYLFHISAIAHNNSATVFRYYLRINNGNIGSGNDAHLRLDRANNAAGATYGPNGSFTYYRYMNVNDYARVYYTADNGAACYSGADYLKFAAHLVG